MRFSAAIQRLVDRAERVLTGRSSPAATRRRIEHTVARGMAKQAEFRAKYPRKPRTRRPAAKPTPAAPWTPAAYQKLLRQFRAGKLRNLHGRPIKPNDWTAFARYMRHASAGKIRGRA